MKNARFVGNKSRSRKVYYLALAFKSLAIAMPHAFLTLIFLGKGMDYSKIAIIQACYSFGVVIFEYPSGVLADKYKKKYIYLVSSLLLIISYLLILFSDAYILLIIAWFVYGVSTALETGTIEAEIIVWIKQNCDIKNMSTEIGSFIGKSGQISSFSAICGACIGFLLYKVISVNIYWIMMSLVLFSGIITLLFFNISAKSELMYERSILIIARDSIKEIRDTPKLKYLVILFAVFQIFIQIHYQLWQSLFLNYGINDNWFIGIYLFFQFITVAAYRTPVNRLFAKTSIPAGVFVIVSSVIMYFVELPILQVVVYMIPVFVISVAIYYAETKYNEIVKTSNISSITSLLSTTTRLCGFLSLLFASKFISLFSIRLLFLVVPIGVICPICLLFDKYVIREPKCTDDNIKI